MTYLLFKKFNLLNFLKSLYIKGRGIKNATSTSKTTNITAKRKNRKEKGTRALPLGSNPHSKADPFSRSKNVR